MKGRPNIITCRFNNPLINKVQSKIKIVTPNYNWNFIWEKRHVHLIATNSRKPTHTHHYVPGGGVGECVCVCNQHKNVYCTSHPNKPAYVVILYTMSKTHITGMYFLSLSQYIRVGILYTHTHTPLECRNVTVYGCVCVIHKHPHMHTWSLFAKAEKTSPVKCLASLTIFKIIMGASAIWSPQPSAFRVGDEREWISNFSS